MAARILRRPSASVVKLGYDTDLDFVFPSGDGVFKAGGDLSYYHGGLSLQELVVPVLCVRMAVAGAKDDEADWKVTLTGVPERIASRIVARGHPGAEGAVYRRPGRRAVRSCSRARR